MSLVIMGCEVKDIPIKIKGLQFDMDGKKELYVDAKGQRVKKIQLAASEYKWVFDDGTEYTGKAYKSFKGKPAAEFKKSTLIEKYEEVDVSELSYVVNNDLTYMLVNAKFKEKLKTLGKALKFNFVIRGFKKYKAYAYYDKDIDRVLMKLTQGDLRTIELNETNDELETTETGEKVESLSLDD